MKFMIVGVGDMSPGLGILKGGAYLCQHHGLHFDFLLQLAKDVGLNA